MSGVGGFTMLGNNGTYLNIVPGGTVTVGGGGMDSATGATFGSTFTDGVGVNATTGATAGLMTFGAKGATGAELAGAD